MLFRRGLDGFVTAIGKVSFFELFVDTGRQFYDMAAGKSLCPSAAEAIAEAFGNGGNGAAEKEAK